MGSNHFHNSSTVFPACAIILASFWFGLRSGLIVAVIVSLIFISSIFNHMHNPQIEFSVYTHIALYVFVAALIG